MDNLDNLFDGALDDMLKSAKDKRKPRDDSEVEQEMNKFFEVMHEKLRSDIPTEAPAHPDGAVDQIFGAMQRLLGRELLLPALADLLPKLQQYISKNDSTLSKEDKKRYRDQCDVIKQMIDLFNMKDLSEKDIFERNMELMEKMQSLGSPPEELVNNQA